MKPILMSMLAVTLAAVATGAAARGQAEAVLAAPVGKPVNTLIESERWKCADTACVGGLNVVGRRLDGPLSLKVCREVALRAGPVRELRNGAAVMSPATLAKCNEGIEQPTQVAGR